MPPKKSNPLTGYISLIGGLIPILAILLGMVVYVINLNSTIGDNASKLEAITEQLNNPAVKEFLEPNQYGETTMSQRLGGFEYELWEQVFPRIEAIEEALILIRLELDELELSRQGILHYLYTMEDGAQKSIIRLNEAIALLEQSVASVHKDHEYFVDVLEEIEDEFDIRLSKPKDVYGSYGR